MAVEVIVRLVIAITKHRGPRAARILCHTRATLGHKRDRGLMYQGLMKHTANCKVAVSVLQYLDVGNSQVAALTGRLQTGVSTLARECLPFSVNAFMIPITVILDIRQCALANMTRKIKDVIVDWSEGPLPRNARMTPKVKALAFVDV